MFSVFISLLSAYTWIRAQRRISASHSDFLMQVDTDVNIWGWAKLWGLDFGSDSKLIEFSFLGLCHTVLPQQNKLRDFKVVSRMNVKPKQKLYFVFMNFILLPPGLSLFSKKTQNIKGFGVFCHCKHIYCITWAIHWLQLPLKHLLKKKMKSLPWFLVCGMSSYELKSQSYA